MDKKIIDLLKDRPIVVPRILMNNYKLLDISDSELIIIMVLLSFGDKIDYNPEEFSKVINGSKHDIMATINNLIEKNILSLVIEKTDKLAHEYISLDLLYEKLYNLVIDNDQEETIDNSIFSVFENELGRMLSPMEYEQIKEWLTSGNSVELITCALKEAVLNGVSSLRYIDSILNDWKKKGYKNKKDIIKEKAVYRSKKEKVEVYDTDWLNE